MNYVDLLVVGGSFCRHFHSFPTVSAAGASKWIGVANEHGDLAALTKADRPLGDRDVQSGYGYRDGSDPQRNVSVTGKFVRNVHQNVTVWTAGIGVENEIKLHAVLVANDGDIVPPRPGAPG